MGIIEKFKSVAGMGKEDLEKANKGLHSVIDATAREGTPENVKRLYSELLKTRLIIPQPVEEIKNPDKMRTLETGTKIKVDVREIGGKKVMPVFTCEKALLIWEPYGSGYMALNSKDVFKMAFDLGVDEICLNPINPERGEAFLGGNLTRREFTALAQGAIPTSSQEFGISEMPAGTKMYLGLPAEPYPKEWISAFSKKLKEFPSVKKAYLYQVAFDTGKYEDSAPHPKLDLVMGNEKDYPEAEKALGELFKEFTETSKKGIWIDIGLQKDESIFTSMPDPKIKPFYVRK